MTTQVRKLRLGMVGGGKDAFIGSVHRIAARLDGRYELVAGALSSSPERARASGQALGLAKDRIYDSFTEMAEAESMRADGIEVVSIVTPNHLHLRVATAFMQRGIHVICDKPLATETSEARDFGHFVKTAPAQFFLTHNYSGYPMVRLMREMILRGDIGSLRVINMEYIQGWLAPEGIDNKQARWRGDPAQAGQGGAIGDIGTHAYHLATWVTGLTANEISADLHSFGTGRQLDDNAHIKFRFGGGAVGSAWISQIAVGSENGLRLRVVGTCGALEFFQEDPNRLIFSEIDQPVRILTRGGPDGSGEVRVPAGHPEGFLEGFATLYSDIADAICGDTEAGARVPSIRDGLEGMSFISAAVASSQRNGCWVSFDAFRERLV